MHSVLIFPINIDSILIYTYMGWMEMDDPHLITPQISSAQPTVIDEQHN